MRILLSVSLLVIVGFVGVASATTITVNNPSFEALVLPCAGGFLCFSAPGDIPDWVTSGRTSTFKPGGLFNSIPNGVNVAAIGDQNGAGNIFQAVPASVQANTLYTLDVSVGARADFPFSQYTVALEAGGTVLASDSSLNPAAASFLPDIITFSSGPAPPTLGQQLDIAISATGLSALGTAAQADFDEVLLDASPSPSVPEPGTLLLLTTSCIGLLGYRCFRRRHAV
jgi:hypothetical protein